MTVHQVTAQLHGASEGDPGQITNGYYVVEDGVLVMTDEAGNPFLGPDGSPLKTKSNRHKLRPGDNAHAIASVLTKKRRRERLGITETEEAFRSKLIYGAHGTKREGTGSGEVASGFNRKIGYGSDWIA